MTIDLLLYNQMKSLNLTCVNTLPSSFHSKWFFQVSTESDVASNLDSQISAVMFGVMYALETPSFTFTEIFQQKVISPSKTLLN